MIVYAGGGHNEGMTPESTDPHLLTAASAGDLRARDALVRAWLPKVLAWCERLGGSSIDADDAAQDAMMVFVRRLGGIGGIEQVGPWLYGVTRKVLAAHRRRAFVRRWLPGVFVDRADPAPGADQHVLRSEAARQVQVIVDAMPFEQREVFVLCDVEGHTDVAAAALIGAPLGTIKSRLRLARARFQRSADEVREPAFGGLVREKP